jgi:hypothetical protein
MRSSTPLLTRRIWRPLFVRRKRVEAIVAPTELALVPVPALAARPDRPMANVPA